MGNTNLDASKDDPYSATMDILLARIHPTYSKPVSYFDVAVLTVKSVPSRPVSEAIWLKTAMQLFSDMKIYSFVTFIFLLNNNGLHFKSQDIRPICLPSEPSSEVSKYDNWLVHLIGWGSAALNEKPSNALRRVAIQIYSQR